MEHVLIVQGKLVILMELVLIQMPIVKMILRREKNVILLVIMNMNIVKDVIEMELVQNVLMINLRI